MQQNGKKRDMRSEQPLWWDERRKHKLNTQFVFAHKRYLAYDHPRGFYYHPQWRFWKHLQFKLKLIAAEIHYQAPRQQGWYELKSWSWSSSFCYLSIQVCICHSLPCLYSSMKQPMQLLRKESSKILYPPEAGGMMLYAVLLIASTILLRI